MPKHITSRSADRGRFSESNAVAVGGEILESEHIVIATGSKPRPLPFPGAELMITSDDVLSQHTLPARVVFVSGGGIALEFSHVYARAGAQVTILEMLPQLLTGMDADTVAQLHSEIERIGVAIHTGVASSERKTASALSTNKTGRSTQSRLIASSMVPAGSLISTASGQVVSHHGGITLDAQLHSTSNTSVYACGDAVATSPQLSLITTYEGRSVGRNIVDGPKHTPDYASIPACVFTITALASVGLTQAAAEQKGVEFRVEVNDMRDSLSRRTYAETAARAKVLVNKATDRIIGAHILGHASEELIHVFALAMKHGIAAGDIKELVYGFPDVLGRYQVDVLGSTCHSASHVSEIDHLKRRMRQHSDHGALLAWRDH